MVLTDLEFLTSASRILSDYDGIPGELQRFVDSLDLVDKYTGTHMNIVVSIVKTKLKGSARNFIQNETTLKEIRDKLKDCIKPESTALIISKLKNLDQLNKTWNEYIRELEILTTSLKRAYIIEGLSIDLAEEFTADRTVEAIKSSTTNDRVKFIMEAGNFKTVAEACTKFLYVNSDFKINNSSINSVEGTSFANSMKQCSYHSSNSNSNDKFSKDKIQCMSQRFNENFNECKKVPRYVRYMQIKTARKTLNQ